MIAIDRSGTDRPSSSCTGAQSASVKHEVRTIERPSQFFARVWMQRPEVAQRQSQKWTKGFIFNRACRIETGG